MRARRIKQALIRVRARITKDLSYRIAPLRSRGNPICAACCTGYAVVSSILSLSYFSHVSVLHQMPMGRGTNTSLALMQRSHTSINIYIDSKLNYISILNYT